ncbi:MAG: aromatic ring-hydroxylating dioxygenase subunit alpha [Gemmatimonadaceae bacterium]
MSSSPFVRTAGTHISGARTLPGEYYHSPAILEREIEQLFRERWLWAGRVERVAKPGDYFLYERFGESVIVLRDRAGVLRAFYNVCRHRGTRMCELKSGSLGSSIQCPYHAWTYGLDGRLLGAPHMQDVEGFDKADFPLHPAPVQEWEGFIFISLSQDPVPFEQAFAPVLNRFERFNLGKLVVVGRQEYDVAANWKLIMQNYNECLHCPTIHPELSKVLPYQSGANDLHAGEQLGGYMELTAGNASATTDGTACGVPIGALSDEDTRRAFYYTFFPNMMLSVHPDYVNYYSVWPVDERHSIVKTEWLQHPSSVSSGHYSPKGAIEFWDTVNRQDWHICERSQLGVESRAHQPGPFSPLESIPAAWDRSYLTSMRSQGQDIT